MGRAASIRAPDEPAHDGADLAAMPKAPVVPAAATPRTVHLLGTGWGASDLQVTRVWAAGAASEVWRQGTRRPGASASYAITVAAGKPAVKLLPRGSRDSDRPRRPETPQPPPRSPP